MSVVASITTGLNFTRPLNYGTVENLETGEINISEQPVSINLTLVVRIVATTTVIFGGAYLLWGELGIGLAMLSAYGLPHFEDDRANQYANKIALKMFHERENPHPTVKQALVERGRLIAGLQDTAKVRGLSDTLIEMSDSDPSRWCSGYRALAEKDLLSPDQLIQIAGKLRGSAVTGDGFNVGKWTDQQKKALLRVLRDPADFKALQEKGWSMSDALQYALEAQEQGENAVRLIATLLVLCGAKIPEGMDTTEMFKNQPIVQRLLSQVNGLSQLAQISIEKVPLYYLHKPQQDEFGAIIRAMVVGVLAIIATAVAISIFTAATWAPIFSVPIGWAFCVVYGTFELFRTTMKLNQIAIQALQNDTIPAHRHTAQLSRFFGNKDTLGLNWHKVDDAGETLALTTMLRCVEDPKGLKFFKEKAQEWFGTAEKGYYFTELACRKMNFPYQQTAIEHVIEQKLLNKTDLTDDQQKKIGESIVNRLSE